MSKGKLGFGMMRLPLLNKEDQTSFDYEELNKMVDLYIESGFNYFDTSYVYHDGKSETAVKKSVVDRYSRDKYILATKLPAFSVTSEDQPRKLIEEQLEHCGVEYFDYYLLHNLNRILYDSTVKTCRMFEQAQEFKKEGIIRHLGFSFHDSADVLDRILSEHPETEFVQIVVNYYDWDSSWVQAGKCYEVIRKHGKKVIVMEPVKGGMLAKVPEEIQLEMKKLEPDLSPSAWAMKYAADLDGVIAVLSGMSNLEQMKDNISTMVDFTPLTEEEKALLAKTVVAYKKSGVYGLEDFLKYDGITPNGMPVGEILDNYNSCELQGPVRTENNYYKSIRYENGIEGSWIQGRIVDHEGNDITEMVRIAEKYLLENSY
ncbi:MAG: aldo/keto reductase [Lachnospiraceae bacterium]|nr:aldo/keto reductase [Lachnospiraceae bacterium]MDD3617342.1 aldo/keto reductase [Lachnospiraceae bacterium]